MESLGGRFNLEVPDLCPPVITQVVPFDSQGNTAEVTTNQALDYNS